MTAPLDPPGPGPIVRAIVRAGRRALGVVLLAAAIGLSTCQALYSVDPEMAELPATHLGGRL